MEESHGHHFASRFGAAFEVTSEDLEAAGYSVKRMATCMVTVKFDRVVRPVTCDAPYLNTGGQGRPLVIDSAIGARSDGRNTRYSNAPMPAQNSSSKQAELLPGAIKGNNCLSSQRILFWGSIAPVST
ncbi:hypothetical protein CTS44_24048 [Comamonas thiooxydans]|nr:hypothetical protein CTS44_24048 [Comamonas thiooxydans]